MTQETGGNVVVGYDSTSTARDALVLAARLAKAVGAKVVVAAVHPDSPPGAGHIDAEWVAALREDAEQRLEQAREVLGPDVPADYRAVPSGSAAHGLDDLAESLKATAIVVGSSKDGPLRRLLAGSTAQRLLQGASVPVVVAPRSHRADLTHPVKVFGCAFVDTADGREALRVAADLASRAGGTLRVFTAVADQSEFAVFAGREQHEYSQAARGLFQSAMDKAVGSLPESIGAVGELLTGDAVGALAALDDRDVDLLVCGSRGYGPLRRVLLGGTSAKLVRRAASPVMVVPRTGS